MVPTPLALKNQLLSGSGDLRSALEVCEKVVEMLKADIAKQDGKPARKSKEAPMPKGRKVTSMGDSGGAKKENKALGSAGKSLLKSTVGSEDKDKRRLKVVVRKRPAIEGESDCVECTEDQVQVRENKTKVDLTPYVQTHVFKFDDTFYEADTTGEVYTRGCAALVGNFFTGGTSTCFCFGQTASGKTFTLFGAEGGKSEAADDDGVLSAVKDAGAQDGGLYRMAAEDIFARLADPDCGFSLVVSMFEIYGQKVRDLLAGGKELSALEDAKGVLQLVGLTAAPTNDLASFLELSNVGRLARATHATGHNATSSRSHAALLLRLVDDASGKVTGKFSLIDLAGAERGKDHDKNTTKKTQTEGVAINSSLLALKEVIRATAMGKPHAPFRQSRLTQVLQECFVGKACQTTVIGCVSPSESDLQETINTLRYAESMSPYRRAGTKAPAPKLTRAEKKAKADEEEKAKITAEFKQMFLEEQLSLEVRREAWRLAKEARLRELEQEREDRAAAEAAAREAEEQARLEAEMRAEAIAAAKAQRAAEAAAAAAEAEAVRLEAAKAQRAREEQAARAMKFKQEVARNKEIAAKAEAASAVRLSRASVDPDSLQEGGSPKEEGVGEDQGNLQPTDEVYELLNEVGLDHLYDDITMNMGGNSLPFLRTFGADGLLRLGVPRIEAKKVMKKVNELCAAPDQLRNLLCELGLQRHYATLRAFSGGTSLPRLLSLGVDRTVAAGLSRLDAKKLMQKVEEVCDGIVSGQVDLFSGAPTSPSSSSSTTVTEVQIRGGSGAVVVPFGRQAVPKPKGRAPKATPAASTAAEEGKENGDGALLPPRAPANPATAGRKVVEIQPPWLTGLDGDDDANERLA